MNALALENTQRSILLADHRYERLILVIGAPGSGKTTILRSVAETYHVPVINVGLQLSELLLEVPASQRPKRVQDRMSEIVGIGNKLLLLDNPEILFAKELKQDPLRLLKAISKERVVVAAWPGKVEGSKLIYAKPLHPEFQSYELLDLLWVETDGKAAIDHLKV